MRQGKETYTKKVDEALKMHADGVDMKEIAVKLGVSFSAVYSWIKKGNKPEPSQIEGFKKYLEQNGPSSLFDIVKIYPKHSEIFLLAKRRGMPIARSKLPRNFGQYWIWYYIKGQETDLEKRMDEVIEKRQQLKNRFLEALDLRKMK